MEVFEGHLKGKTTQNLPPKNRKKINYLVVHPSSEVVVRFYFATKFSSEIVSPPTPHPTPPPNPPKSREGLAPPPL